MLTQGLDKDHKPKAYVM